MCDDGFIMGSIESSSCGNESIEVLGAFGLGNSGASISSMSSGGANPRYGETNGMVIGSTIHFDGNSSISQYDSLYLQDEIQDIHFNHKSDSHPNTKQPPQHSHLHSHSDQSQQKQLLLPQQQLLLQQQYQQQQQQNLRLNQFNLLEQPLQNQQHQLKQHALLLQNYLSPQSQQQSNEYNNQPLKYNYNNNGSTIVQSNQLSSPTSSNQEVQFTQQSDPLLSENFSAFVVSTGTPVPPSSAVPVALNQANHLMADHLQSYPHHNPTPGFIASARLMYSEDGIQQVIQNTNLTQTETVATAQPVSVIGQMIAQQSQSSQSSSSTANQGHARVGQRERDRDNRPKQRVHFSSDNSSTYSLKPSKVLQMDSKNSQESGFLEDGCQSGSAYKTINVNATAKRKQTKQQQLTPTVEMNTYSNTIAADANVLEKMYKKNQDLTKENKKLRAQLDDVKVKSQRNCDELSRNFEVMRLNVEEQFRLQLLNQTRRHQETCAIFEEQLAHAHTEALRIKQHFQARNQQLQELVLKLQREKRELQGNRTIIEQVAQDTNRLIAQFNNEDIAYEKKYEYIMNGSATAAAAAPTDVSISTHRNTVHTSGNKTNNNQIIPNYQQYQIHHHPNQQQQQQQQQSSNKKNKSTGRTHSPTPHTTKYTGTHSATTSAIAAGDLSYRKRSQENGNSIGVGITTGSNGTVTSTSKSATATIAAATSTRTPTTANSTAVKSYPIAKIVAAEKETLQQDYDPFTTNTAFMDRFDWLDSSVSAAAAAATTAAAISTTLPASTFIETPQRSQTLDAPPISALNKQQQYHQAIDRSNYHSMTHHNGVTTTSATAVSEDNYHSHHHHYHHHHHHSLPKNHNIIIPSTHVNPVTTSYYNSHHQDGSKSERNSGSNATVVAAVAAASNGAQPSKEYRHPSTSRSNPHQVKRKSSDCLCDNNALNAFKKPREHASEQPAKRSSVKRGASTSRERHGPSTSAQVGMGSINATNAGAINSNINAGNLSTSQQQFHQQHNSKRTSSSLQPSSSKYYPQQSQQQQQTMQQQQQHQHQGLYHQQQSQSLNSRNPRTTDLLTSIAGCSKTTITYDKSSLDTQTIKITIQPSQPISSVVVLKKRKHKDFKDSKHSAQQAPPPFVC